MAGGTRIADGPQHANEDAEHATCNSQSARRRSIWSGKAEPVAVIFRRYCNSLDGEEPPKSLGSEAALVKGEEPRVAILLHGLELQPYKPS
jgi:hypothetical protein